MKHASVIVLAAVVLSGALVPRSASAVAVPEQTPVQVRLLQDLKSGHQRKGDLVRMEVASPVKGPDGGTLIAQGTPVVGTITRSGGRGMFGKPGKLEFTIDYIKLDEKQRVPLRSTATAVRGRSNSGAAIATAVLFAPIAIFVKGREVTVKQGREFGVFVDVTTELSSIAGNSAGSPSVARLTTIVLKSGLVIEGTVVSYREGAYTIVNGLGQSVIPEDRIKEITGAKVAVAAETGEK